MGVNLDIPVGHLFPQVSDDPDISIDELQAMQRRIRTHPSFLEKHGETRAPGLALIEEHVNKGLGRLCTDMKETE